MLLVRGRSGATAAVDGTWRIKSEYSTDGGKTVAARVSE